MSLLAHGELEGFTAKFLLLRVSDVVQATEALVTGPHRAPLLEKMAFRLDVEAGREPKVNSRRHVLTRARTDGGERTAVFSSQ